MKVLTNMLEYDIHIPPELIQKLRLASSVTMLTGAGMSVESGIPTFRDSKRGLWAKYNAQELATPQAFQNDPELVWNWYRWRKNLISQSQPNSGHFAIFEMEKRFANFALITQNIDGLHQAAGSSNVIELHGNLHRAYCSHESLTFGAWPNSNNPVPTCPNCGEPLRPEVVWFGESLNPDGINAAVTASRNCDLFFSVGTSGIVEPAASLAYEALRNKIPVVEVNPESTPLTIYAAYSFPYPAGVFLPELIHSVWND